MAYPPTIPPNTRTNLTAQDSAHPGDHNAISDALTGIVNELGANPSGASATVQDRIANLESGSWVTTARLVDGAVTAAKLANGSVDPSKLAANWRMTFSCTSTTRPAAPVDGQVIYETDTDRIRVWDGGQWDMVYGLAGCDAAGTASCANAVTTSLAFSSVGFNSDGWITAGGTTFLCPEDGNYMVTYQFVRTGGTQLYDGFTSYFNILFSTRNFRVQSVQGAQEVCGTFVYPMAAGNTVQTSFLNATGNTLSLAYNVNIRFLNR